MHIDEAATELLSITVDGEEHSYEATVDMNHDGVDDTVHVNTDNGSYEYSDTDGDGVADTLTQFGADGHESGHAEFDATTGGWNSTTESSTPGATVDSNNDGVPDTIVTHNPDGSTVLATDLDGDGAPDAVTEISASGDYSSYEETGDGTWTEVGHGGIAGGQSSSAIASAPSVIDPTTGLWVRR